MVKCHSVHVCLGACVCTHMGVYNNMPVKVGTAYRSQSSPSVTCAPKTELRMGDEYRYPLSCLTDPAFLTRSNDRELGVKSSSILKPNPRN